MPAPKFKAPRPADELSDDEPFVFPVNVQSDVDNTAKKLAELKGRIVSLRRGKRPDQDAVPGKDSATKAGYDPSDRNKIATLVKQGRELVKTTRTFTKDISLAKAVIWEQESSVIVSGDSKDDESARHRTALRVIKFLVRSPTNFHTLLGGLGVEITAEIKSALQSNLSQMSDSQTEQLIQRSRQSDDYLELQQRFDQQNDQLNVTKREAEGSKELAESMESKYKDAESRASKYTRRSFDNARAYSRAKHDLQKANKSVADLETALQGTNSSKLALQKELESLKEQAVDQGQTEADLRRKLSEQEFRSINLEQTNSRLEHEKVVLRNEEEANQKALSDQIRDLDCHLKAAEKKAVHLGEKAQETGSEIREVRTERDNVTLELSGTKGRLQSVTEEAAKLREDVKALQRNNSEQHKALEVKDRQIQELRVAFKEQEAQTTQRDQAIKSQVQQASIFLRHLSIGAKSQVWQTVAEQALADSARTSATLTTWRPWKIFPSWSSDVSLDIRRDDRSLDAIALDVLATMDVKSVDAKSLLGSLQAMQDAMSGSSSMASVINSMLLGSFVKSVGDPRSHLMHRVAMCQIATLLAPTAEALQPFRQALDAVDPRVNLLVNALRAYDPDSHSAFQLGASINFPGLALVGFNREPEGVIALNLAGREICWVDCTRIRKGYSTIELLPLEGKAITLSLDNLERSCWVVTHT
ncbi:hypothetical protein ACHAPA_004531 [Fusarium lateritium]